MLVEAKEQVEHGEWGAVRPGADRFSYPSPSNSTGSRGVPWACRGRAPHRAIRSLA